MSSYKNSNCLLLLSCSDTKRYCEGKHKALDLYDGPSFRIIRKLMREGLFPENLEIYIVSGKYGLISSEDVIEYYDRSIDEEVVRRTEARRKLEALIFKGHEKIFVNMGKNYTRHFKDLLEGAMVAEGRIGQKNAQMKKWILSL